MSDDKKIIFSMRGLSKSFNNNNKQVLKNIHLSFFYGAKTGIIGLNGSGKSTLLKIIAGVEKSFQGDVTFSDGYNVGYLEQEPKLDESKTVMDIVKEGAKEQVELLEEYNKIFNEMKDLKGAPYFHPVTGEKITLLKENRVSEVKDLLKKLLPSYKSNTEIVDHIYQEQLNSKSDVKTAPIVKDQKNKVIRFKTK